MPALDEPAIGRNHLELATLCQKKLLGVRESCLGKASGGQDGDR